MNLRQRDGDADARQHAMHDGRRNDQRPACHLEPTQQKLNHTRTSRDQTHRLPAKLSDQPRHDDGQAGRWTRNLKR